MMAYKPINNIATLWWVVLSLTFHILLGLVIYVLPSWDLIIKAKPLFPVEIKTNEQIPQKKLVETQIGVVFKPKKASFVAEQNNTVLKETKGPKNLGLKSHSLFKAHNPSKSRENFKDDPLAIKPKIKVNYGSDARDDYLPDKTVGSETALNTWQWSHAPFFNRIKNQVSQAWLPAGEIARHDPSGRLLGNQDRVTVLSVTINNEGKLVNLFIIEPSGVNYLDDEAKRAFTKAAPFLYPPKELFLDNDSFTFTFAFHVLINRGFSLSIDW
jgi:TonB family protein